MATLTVDSHHYDGRLLAIITDDVSLNAYRKTRSGESPAAITADTTHVKPQLGQSTSGQPLWQVVRQVLFFDATAAPDNAVISAAKIKINVETDDTAQDFDIVVVTGRDMSRPLVEADYGRLSSVRTSLGSLSTSGIAVGWNDIDLNASGIAAISLTEPTAFALRSSRDINGQAPALDGASPEVIKIYHRNQSQALSPKLEITYTTASPSVNTDDATSITTTGATMNLTLVDDGGGACDCNFEWGRTTAYGNTTATASKTTGQTHAQALTGLLPNTLYHFRAKAVDNGNTVYGADKTFMTLAPVAGQSPTIVSGLVGSLQWDIGPGKYDLWIGLGGYGRAFSTIPWGHYGAGDPDIPPDFGGPPPSADEICARAQEAYVAYQQFAIHPPIGMTPEEQHAWNTQKNNLWNIYVSLHAACSLARRQEGGASGVNQ